MGIVRPDQLRVLEHLWHVTRPMICVSLALSMQIAMTGLSAMGWKLATVDLARRVPRSTAATVLAVQTTAATRRPIVVTTPPMTPAVTIMYSATDRRSVILLALPQPQVPAACHQ